MMEIELKRHEAAYALWMMEGKSQDHRVPQGTSPHARVVTRLLLENQRLANEHFKYSPEDSETLMDTVAETVPHLMAFHLVSVQPKLGPNSILYNDKRSYANNQLNWVVEEEDCVARTRKLKVGSLNPMFLGKEIDTEIVTDLVNNCGTVANRTVEDFDWESVYSALCQMISIIQVKTGRQASWILTTPSIADKYSKAFEAFKIGGRRKVMVMDAGVLHNKILLGCKGDKYYESAYTWAPYILLGQHQNEQGKQYLMRYGKKLTRDGMKSYGKIVLGETPSG